MTGFKKQRIDLRATAEQKAVIEQAALLKQTSVSDFVLDAAYTRAQKVIRQYSNIVLTTSDWRILCQAIETNRQSLAVRNLIKRKVGHSRDANEHS